MLAPVVLVIGLGSVPAPAAAAQAAPVHAAAHKVPGHGAAAKRKHRAAQRSSRLIRAARSKAGAPYAYGATGPAKFDCSGYTRWVYRHVGEALPHNSAAQAGRVKRIRARDARRGDLVFFNSGGIHHVGIYAGHHQIWHAPYSGTRVRKERIWTSSVFYGRVRQAPEG